MGISDIKKGFGEKGERIEKTSTPPPKDYNPATTLPSKRRAPEKKDTSAFQGKSYLKRGEVREWLKRPEVYKIIPRSREKMAKLEKELFGPESGKYGPFIERAKKEPERLLNEIETGKVKPPAGFTKRQAKSLLEKFSGK